MNFAIQLRQCRLQVFPLFLRKCRVCSTGAAHPRIDLVLDAVMVGRTKEQLAHRTNDHFWGLSAPAGPLSGDGASCWTPVFLLTSAPCSRKRRTSWSS